MPSPAAVSLRPAALLALAAALALPWAAEAAGPRRAAQQRALSRASSAACARCSVVSLQRRVLVPGVAEYSFELRVGPGRLDTIGMHRVVKERAPWVPAPTSDALMMVHGDLWPFDAAFLSAAATPAVPDGHALPVFLAQGGVDVWGLDLRWTRVPLETSDFSFMARWGIETDARDLGISLVVARLARAYTGHGLGRLHLLGWSRGGHIGYAYLAAETRLPTLLRQVKGFIPVDIYLKTDVPELRQGACTRYALEQARIDGGEIAEGIGQLIGSLGDLALNSPGDPSAVVPGLTNEQAGLLVGSATYQFQPPGLAPVPFYHFTGGSFEGGVPTGLLYTDPDLFLTFLGGTSPWQPLRELAEADASICDGPEAPDQRWDDRLDRIRVPVFYVGAAGGFGETGIYTTTLLDSTDVETLVVSLQPPEDQPFDFGHGDLFQADDAPALVWQPILDWIEDH